MDLGRILSRAWEITWRWKVLWILGFLAALGEGTGGSNVTYRLNSGDVGNFNFPAIAGAAIVGLVCIAFIVAIALWIISVIARGGLIAGVAQVEEEGSTTLGRAWAVGQSRFWTLFGIGVLTALPVILLVLAMVIGVFFVAGGAALAGSRGNSGVGGLVGGLLACICPSVCLLVILGVVLGQIRIYAERAAILENLGWLDAFGRGWRVLRDNLGTTILLWIIFLVLGLVVGAIALAITLPIVLPLAALFSNASGSAPNALLFVPLCGAGLIGIIVAAIVGAIINTFTSATWTVAYRQMIAGTPLSPAAPLPPVDTVAPGGPAAE